MLRFILSGITCTLLLSSWLLAQPDCLSASLTPQREGFHPGDLQVLKDIIRLNELEVSPLELGRQVWEKGRLTWFALGEDEIQIHRLPESMGCHK